MKLHEPFRAACLVGLAVLLSGCHTSHLITRMELRKLDGFRKGDEVNLLDYSGKVIVFTADTPLIIIVPGRRLDVKYVEIEVVDNEFRGITNEGADISFDINEVRAAAVYLFSGWSLFGWTMVGVGGAVAVTIVVAAVTAVVLIVYFIILVLSNSGDE
ncbi:MAG: hypothetical protein O6952_07655 [Planctomycetota bacterium]|nr:hypothetical protein [Planctomycetota bacterium]